MNIYYCYSCKKKSFSSYSPSDFVTGYRFVCVIGCAISSNSSPPFGHVRPQEGRCLLHWSRNAARCWGAPPLPLCEVTHARRHGDVGGPQGDPHSPPPVSVSGPVYKLSRNIRVYSTPIFGHPPPNRCSPRPSTSPCSYRDFSVIWNRTLAVRRSLHLFCSFSFIYLVADEIDSWNRSPKQQWGKWMYCIV